MYCLSILSFKSIFLHYQLFLIENCELEHFEIWTHLDPGAGPLVLKNHVCPHFEVGHDSVPETATHSVLLSMKSSLWVFFVRLTYFAAGLLHFISA